MEVLNIEDIVRECRGTPFNLSENMFVNSISTDTRRIKEGELYIPLRGERFDGHDYIMDAFAKGAKVVLTEIDIKSKEKPYIIVENTLEALQNISSYYKSLFDVKIVAITGSSGKTTTKDMIASVVSERYKVLKTEGNLNNAIGLPLTLLNLDSSHEAAVLEMGMNSFGEIEKLAELARPHLGVITNVGTAHIEKLQTRENILKAKLELFTYFDQKNTAIINGDNDLLKTLDNVPYNLIRFGLGTDNDFKAYDIVENGVQGIDFSVDIKGISYRVKVPVPGLHNVYNALSALCVGLELNMKMEEIISGIGKFKPSKLRMEIFTIGESIRIINDVYNANPDSMCAAINVLNNFRDTGRTVCILGDMLELGDMSEELHRKVGEYLAEVGTNEIITVGMQAKHIALEAIAKGVNIESVHMFESTKMLENNIRQLIRSGDTVLIKGSRGMKMETIVEFLRERG